VHGSALFWQYMPGLSGNKHADGLEENMSDYRRLISYIYEYEGKEKGKNVGFVKLEARNGQCRLNLSVKKVYVGGNAVGVYLLGKDGSETFLGNIFIRGGNGEFRAVVDASNVEGSKNGLDTYYGLTVHDVKNSWRSYTTIWEDAVVPERSGNRNPAQPGLPAGDTSKLLPASEVLPGSSEVKTASEMSSVVKEIEEEIAREEAGKNRPEESTASEQVSVEETEERMEAAAIPPAAPVVVPLSSLAQPSAPMASMPSEVQPQPAAPMAPLSSSVRLTAPMAPMPSTAQPQPVVPEAPMPTSVQPAASMPPARSSVRPTTPTAPMQPFARPAQPAASAAPAPSAVQAQPQPVVPAVSAPTPAQSPVSRPSRPEKPVPQSEPMLRSPELENPDVLRYLQQTEDLTADPEKLWQDLRKAFPKIQPFDYENGCEVLTIRPQDIGRLPRESWVYGNNSFLLHGYYNYRYIILFRLGSKDGRFRYLLGVPGHYYSSEKYMASMFGFPNFVLSKKQPPNDGRFGYWYTDIKIR